MRKPKSCPRGRQRKQPTNRAITLAVEALEPRLVLSAVDLGFEGVREQLDFHVRDHGNGEAYRSAFVRQVDGPRGNERFEFVNPSEFILSKPSHDVHARGGQSGVPISLNYFEHERRGSRFNEQSGKPRDHIASGEGESPFSMAEFEDFSSQKPIDELFAPNPYAGTTIPTSTLVFVPLTTTTSPTRGDDFLGFGQRMTSVTQPPRASTAGSIIQQSSAAATLPVEGPVSPLAASGTPPNPLSIGSSTIRLDFGTPDSDMVSVQPASETPRIAEPGFETFVSLATNDLARSWNVDGESLEAGFKAVDPLAKSVRPTAATEPQIVSSNDTMIDQRTPLSEESLWAGVSEGGFIEIDTDAVENARERFEFEEDSDCVSGSKRLSKQTLRDAFWFDFGTLQFDLSLESNDVHDLAEDQALVAADDAAEKAWLLDDGGMIVVASPPLMDQVAEVAVDAASRSSTSETAAGENDIPMDAGIGVFQAIEVAGDPVEQQAADQAAEATPSPIGGQAPAEADDAIPVAGEMNTESGPPQSFQAASMPLLLAFTAFLSRGREKRNKVVDRQTKV